MSLFMNTVRYFVEISTQTNCCLALRHIVFNFGFVELMMLHLKPWLRLIESTEPTQLMFVRLPTHIAFFWYHMYGCLDFTNRCLN